MKPNRHLSGTYRVPTRCQLPTPDIILALCLAREIQRDFGSGGHTTRATQDAAIAALTVKEKPNGDHQATRRL